MTTKIETTRNLIASFLGDCIDAAPEEKRNALGQAIEDYAKLMGGRRWTQITSARRHPALLIDLIDVMIERADARPNAEDL